MIHVTVFRSSDRRIRRVVVEGHAGYADPGEDIVCAAVSGITLGLVNSTERLLGVRVHQSTDREGKVDCRVPEAVSPELTDRIQLLMEAMVTSLAMVAEEYPDFVRLSDSIGKE